MLVDVGSFNFFEYRPTHPAGQCSWTIRSFILAPIRILPLS